MADRQGEKDHRHSIALGKRKEPEVPATDCPNNSCNTPMLNSAQTIILPAPPVRNQTSFTAVCPACNKEKEYSMIIMNHIVLCRRCNEFYRATEPKSLPPRSSTSFRSQFPRRTDDSNSTNVPDIDRFQYEHALNNPRYFDSLLECIWKEKNKPFVVPIFQGKELNMHRIFAEVTSRGGINMVTREGRLPEVCATIDENLRDGDLYHIYMEQLYDVETFLCSFLTNGPSSSSPGQHLMQGLIGQNPSSSSETASLVASLSGEQHPSQRIQASALYTSSAPVNNDQRLMSQWIQPSALYPVSEPMNIDQQLTIQPIRASAPYTSSAPMNIDQQLTRQWIQASAPYTSSAPVHINQQLTSEPIRASAPYTSAEPVNINQHLTRQPIGASVPHTSAEPVNINQHSTRQPNRASASHTNSGAVNINQHLTRQLIRASAPHTNSGAVNNNQQLTRQLIGTPAPYTNSAALNNNQQLTGSSSGPHPMQMVIGESPPYLTDNPQDFPSSDERQVQPLQLMLQFPDVGSTGIHGRSTPGLGMFHRHPWEHPGAQRSSSETDSSSPSASRKQS